MIKPSMRFEAVRHAMDRGTYTVPLLLDDDRNPSHPHTESLLRAAEIIAPRLNDTESGSLDLEALVSKLHLLIEGLDNAKSEGESPQAVTIEDKYGLGAVVVRREVSTIALREQPELQVPSWLMYNMLTYWNTSLTGQQPAQVG